MAGSVIIRHGHTVDEDGFIHHDDQPSTWEEADRIAGRRVDRRKAYAIIDGALCDLVRWTSGCSGCTNDLASRGFGCRECGFRGVVRRAQWCPTIAEAAE